MTDPITGNSQWSTGSTYDANGNVQTTTDAKGITISQTYDCLNRPLVRDYSDGTPSVENTYDDTSVPFSRGRLTKISSAVSTTEYTNFDALGKVLAHRQTTDGKIYDTSYIYNLHEGLVEETYPSGRVVKYTPDSDGRLEDVTTKKVGQTSFHLSANNIAYAASGAVSSMRLGNGLWESALVNSRLQITQIGLGTSNGATNLWKLNYDYGEIDSNGTLDVNKNSGSIARQSINFTGLSNPFVQTYQYDPLNRLSQAREVNGTTETFNQTFGYDRFGNRTSFAQTISSQQITQTPSVDPVTNRFTTGQGFEYDLNGNLVTDTQGRQFTFNGDNKQTQVTDSASNTVGLYYYDGTGARVKKISPAETTIFVYNALGKLVAEYSTQAPTSPTISYLTNDTLGSPRVVTDNNGDVKSRRDFMPFGDELYAGTANRTVSDKYSISGVDNVRKRFTGYEKDVETGLDFAEARYYDNKFGRFTAVDPLLASGQSSDPQSFNRYVYVMNNPTNSTDPTGLWTDKQWSSVDPGYFSPSWDEGASVRHPVPFIEYKQTTTTTTTSYYAQGNPFASRQFQTPLATQTNTSVKEEINGEVVSTMTSSSSNTSRPWVIPNVGGLVAKIRAGGYDGEYSGAGSKRKRWCATLLQTWSGNNGGEWHSPASDVWIMGAAVTYNMDMASGTALATFDRVAGKYNNNPTGNHALIFLSWTSRTVTSYYWAPVIGGTPFGGMPLMYPRSFTYVQGGMDVIEQGPTFAPRITTKWFDSSGNYFKDAAMYNVIRVK